MATLTSIYECHEVIVDDNDDFIEEHKSNLPHADLIANEFTQSWNKDADAFLLKYLNEQVAKDRIASCYAKKMKAKNGECRIGIEIIAKPHTVLPSKMKYDIFEWISSQFSDGWGEGFFGLINVMTAPDGTRFYVD